MLTLYKVLLHNLISPLLLSYGCFNKYKVGNKTSSGAICCTDKNTGRKMFNNGSTQILYDTTETLQWLPMGKLMMLSCHRHVMLLPD